MSAALREALKRAWVNYGVMELCFRDVEAGGLAYSMALHFARHQTERETIRRDAASWAQDGMQVKLTKLEPGTFVVARKWSRYVSVLHPEHGVRVLVGETSTGCGEPVEVVVTPSGYALKEPS